MRFQLMSAWPGPGGMFFEGGTVIDGDAPQWSGVQMPLNAKCLDQEAYDAMVRWYEPHTDNFLHLLHYANGVQPKNGN